MTQNNSLGALAQALALTLILAGCSSNPLPSLTTGSLFGSKPDAKAAAAAAPVVRNDATTRALQVGRVAAKAQRCGFNVDTAKLKGNFLAADDSPWELLMATGFLYALPPAAIYYAFKRYMVSGLTAGAVKS